MQKFFLALLALLAITGGAIFYFTQDANRFKPELEALIAEQTGVPVQIEGDLAWRLWPPLPGQSPCWPGWPRSPLFSGVWEETGTG
ncbi:MAG: AsmA family protein, partial [Proteobacteria bacterium]|nr:AsmA family protein [Pseudomonadota bacterium]